MSRSLLHIPNTLLLTAIVLTVAMFGAIFPQGNASADASSFISDNAGLSLNSGTDPLIVSSNPNVFHEYYIHNVGHVSSSNAYPFNGGSGYNSKYDGHQIVILENSSAMTHCIGVDYSTLNLDSWDNGACSTANNKTLMFVESGGWLVSVGATNYEGTSEPTRPEIMTANCNQTGCRVLAAVGDTSPADLQNWSY